MQTTTRRRLVGQLIAASVPLFLVTANVAAQSVTRAPSQTRAVDHLHDPVKAAALAVFIPGAGYIYSHEYAPGVAMLVGTVPLLLFGNEVRQWNGCTFVILGACDPDREPFRALGIMMMAGSVLVWAGSVIDAPRAARRANAEHRRATGLAVTAAPGGVGVGWHLQF